MQFIRSAINTPNNREAVESQEVQNWFKPESLAKVICFLGSIAAKELRGAVVPVYGRI